jgi:flavorubredoxin
MSPRTDKIADRIYRFSTFVPEIPPLGFTFNQYLIDADEPFLFHCGPRAMFPAVSAAVAEIIPLESLRWISFGHIESDESGSMNHWLAAAPRAQVVQGALACLGQLNDLCDRPPRMLGDGEVLDIGSKRVRWIDTPHVPHAWESGLVYEETTQTLFCGDLFAQVGDGMPAVTKETIIPAAIQTEEIYHASSLAPAVRQTLRKLASIGPARLAVMHGACFEGNVTAALVELGEYYDRALKAASSAA